MKILIISLFPLERNTSVANSSISIINGIKALGHKVYIVMPSWPSNETSCNIDDLTVIRIPGKPNTPPKQKIFQKLHSHFDFLDLTRGYIKHIKEVAIPDEYYDVVLSFSDPKTSHVFTAKILKKKKIKYGEWIQHWGDPIIGDITRNFWWPQWAIKLYERNLIKKADWSIYVTPFTYKMIATTYPSLTNLLVFIPLPAEMLPTIDIPKSKVLRLSYLGDFNPSFRNLKPLYDACSHLDNIYLTIAGHGPEYPKHSNICQLPRIPQTQAKTIEDNSDVLVCVCNIRGTQIPGKIMYKTSTHKHILVAVEKDHSKEIVEYLNSFKRFIICNNTEESILAAINNIRKMDNKEYTTPNRLLPINIAKEILVLHENFNHYN